MKRLNQTIALLVPILAVCLFAPSARANTISGTAYCNISSADDNNAPAPGAAHSGTACATFTSADINFNNNGANTVGSFLNSGNLVGPVTYLNGFSAASNLDSSLFIFTGTAYFNQGQTYSATHDDGIVMSVGNSIVINSPGQTAPITSTFVFSNTSGAYDFQYDYVEAFGGSTYTTNAVASPIPNPKASSSSAPAPCFSTASFAVVPRRIAIRRSWKPDLSS